MYAIPHTIRRFAIDEDAAVTVLALTMLTALLLVGSYAVDVGNVMRARTQLQVSVDSVAHAALVQRELNSSTLAKAEALRYAETNMPQAQFGHIITESDIVFGNFNEADFRFTPNAGSRNAVQVTARRVASKSNALDALLLKLVGFDKLDVVTSSTFTTFLPTCMREGYVAEARVDLQSNNVFQNGFCVHSNTRVEMNSNNVFEEGTIVSMPDLDNLVIPASGMRTNVGLGTALREGQWNIKIIGRISNLITWLETFARDKFEVLNPYPPYITQDVLVNLPTPVQARSGTVYTMARFTPNRVNVITCTARVNSLTFNGSALAPIKDVVIITKGCNITFGQGLVVENAVIATTSTSAVSMTSPSGFQLGKNDNCAEGGGAQLLTLGGVRLAAGMSAYNGQILAAGDVYFRANANQIKGISIVSGRTIDTTSNGAAAFCGTGWSNNFMAAYFRMAL